MSKGAKIQYIMEFLVDFVSLFVANLVSYFIFHNIVKKIMEYSIDDWVQYSVALVVAFVIIFIGFHNQIILDKRNRWNEFISVCRNVFLTYMLFSLILIILKNPIMDSRFLFVSGCAIYFALSCLGRYLLKRWLTNSFSKSKVASIVGVITVSDRANDFIDGIQKDWSRRITGIAILDAVCEDGVFQYNQPKKILNENGETTTIIYEKLDTVESINDIPVVANYDNFMDWIRSSPLDEVFINLPYQTGENIQPIVDELESMGITVHINVPDLQLIMENSKYDNIKCQMFAHYPMATFAATVHNASQLAFKRIFDIFIGIIGFILSLPIVLITAIPLLIESKGPLVFKQPRVGKNGRIFNCYKLRSMYVDAEKRKQDLMEQNKMKGFMFKMDNDPRITKVGKFIRKTSIDELPQFINVIKGDMSLIGTRPPTVDEFEKYENRHKRRLSMRPGITGMWQVSGRSKIQDFEEVVRLDCEYIDNWCIWLDIVIFFKTIGVVLKGSGAE